MTRHFNRLTEPEQERLAILVEECGEVIQAACKILRHGYESTNPKSVVPDDQRPETNRAALERELGHVQYAIHSMGNRGDLDRLRILEHSSVKADNVTPYLHHEERK